MGNITQLKQGSLAGLRRQTNECLDNAYRRGYDDGRIDATNTELVKELKQAEYQRGLEDGNKIADKDLEEIVAYNKGLQDGYEGYRYLQKWFATTCFYDVEGILFPEYKRREANTCCLEDIITDVGLAKVLRRAKAYDEKKKAEEEPIKVGDEVYLLDKNHPIVVTNIDDHYITCLAESGTYSYYVGTQKDRLTKTGRHFDEVEQLFDKLRNKEDEGE